MHRTRFFLSFLVFCFAICCFSPSTAQSSSKDSFAVFNIFKQLKETPSGSGTVKINSDDRLEAVMRSHFSKGNSTTIKGWRIRIIRDNRQDARRRAEQVMANIRGTYPDTPVYMSYEAPYYYVAVGDYRSRDAAEKMKRSLKASYPGASLIQTNIKFPPL